MIQEVIKIYNLSGINDTYKVIYENGDKLFVPLDEGNRHYQEVLAWVEEGNEIREPE